MCLRLKHCALEVDSAAQPHPSAQLCSALTKLDLRKHDKSLAHHHYPALLHVISTLFEAQFSSDTAIEQHQLIRSLSHCDTLPMMPPRSGLTSSFSVTDANNEVVCPLKNHDGSSCRKRCIGVRLPPAQSLPTSPHNGKTRKRAS